MNATTKQVNYITALIEQDDSLTRLWQSMPKNNDKYPNTGADYRRMIFSEKLMELEISQAAQAISILLNTKLSSAKRGLIVELLTDNKILWKI